MSVTAIIISYYETRRGKGKFLLLLFLNLKKSVRNITALPRT